MSIYGYFFFHSAKFLNEKGRVGFITSNSWLDVDYGKYLQEFFLKNFKIVAIIESKLERWFEYADVNTCIIILEKCRGESRRKKNLVKFVQLNKPLKDFIDLQNENERWKSINKLVRLIENKKNYYEDERIKIYPIEQRKLWEEGFEEDSGKYEGSKWGKYLRAPEILFKILEKGKDLFVSLKEVADVRFGIKTGANEFFYLTEEDIQKWGIGKEFLQPIIFTLKEVEGYSVDKNRLKYKVLICHKQKEELKGTNVLKYIEYGEERGREFHKRPTCGSRSPWYALGKGWNYAPLIFPAKVGERMPVFLNDNVFEDKKLYRVTPKNKEDTLLLGALLNSTVSRLIIEHTCRQLTGAQAIADIDVVVVEHLGIPNPSELSKKIRAKLENSFRELSETSCDSIFEEIGANSPEQVSLDKVKPDRGELDKIVMSEILGLTEEGQLEVYKAVVDLVKSRLEKAGSVPKRAKRKGVDIGALAEGILREIDISELKKFPGDYIGGEECREIEVPEGKPEVGSDLHGFFVKISDARIECGSQEEAKYIEYAIMNGNAKIRIPKDEGVIKKAVESYGSAYNKLKGDVSAYTRRTIQNNKLREKVEAVVWERIIRHQEF